MQGEDGGGNPSQEPPAEDYERWVKWRGQTISTPGWWWELLGIPGVSDVQELAWKIRASFELPCWMSELHNVENYYLAPLAPRCILPPQDPLFPCQDIREGQSQKTVAYVQALQYWAEKANPPIPSQPCLLVRCILKVRKVMEQYVSFSKDVILDGAAPQEGSLMDPTKVTIPRNDPPVSTSSSTKKEPAEEPAPTEVVTEEAVPTGRPLEGPTHQWLSMIPQGNQLLSKYDMGSRQR